MCRFIDQKVGIREAGPYVVGATKEEAMSIKQLDHLNLTVKDLNETIAWYKAVFGFEVVEEDLRNGTRWAIIRGGEAMLCIYERPERDLPHLHQVPGSPQHTVSHWGFRITDLEAWLEAVREHNLELEYGGVVDYPYSQSWYVTDPTGYEIEVVYWKEDEIRFGALAAS
jgi:catechol-2,3-dioxygenase